MSRQWPRVSLGELLCLERRPVKIDPEKLYQEIGIYCFGRGIFHKAPRTSFEVGDKDLFLMKEGDFILQVTFAWEGAVAIVSATEDGMYGSTRYPTFRVDESRCVPQFLLNYFKTQDGLRQLVKICPGSAGRNRVLSIKRIPEVLVPLPPLAEQQRVVARIEELAVHIHEAQTLRHQAAEEAGALLLNQVGKVFSCLEARYTPREFASFSPHVTSGPRNWAKHYERDGFRFYRAQDIGPVGKILDDSKVFITPPPSEQGRSAMLQHGDLMLVITGATVGRVNVYRECLEPGFVSQHVGICRLPQCEVEPEFALWGLRSPKGQDQILRQRYGQGKPGLNLSNIRALSLPFPPLAEQCRVVAELDALQAEVDALKRFQAETAVELEALLPAVLDKAFRGEL